MSVCAWGERGGGLKLLFAYVKRKIQKDEGKGWPGKGRKKRETGKQDGEEEKNDNETKQRKEERNEASINP